MTEPQKKVIDRRLQRAHEALTEAKILMDAHHYIGAVNRFYYACFYAVTALFETQDLSSSKHSGVRSLFNLHFVKSRAIPSS
ncbi:HEPN domain-containing protein [candidate division KSB1 bacterium]|nr:HEPN domain-containing protein [candidate division KSB1 bacterium]